MSFINHLLPLLIVGAIVVLIATRHLPRLTIPMPRPKPRPKRGPKLRIVKGAAMDRELAELLKREERPRQD